MIKLIATDLDGTLLNSRGELPNKFYEVLNNLIDKGVLFVAASGRQYQTLAENFKLGKDKIIFAAENGSYVVYRDNEIFSETIDRAEALEIIRDARKIHGCNIVLSGKKYAYVENNEQEFIEQMSKYYHSNKLVNNLENVQDDFFKVALYNYNGAEACYKIMEPKWGKILKVFISGEKWVDLGRNDMDKGVAIKYIQNKFGIKHEETMAFGDYFNDIQLLQSAYHSYAMENAPDGVKQYGRFVAESNDEDGVLKVIRNEVLLKEA